MGLFPLLLSFSFTSSFSVLFIHLNVLSLVLIYISRRYISELYVRLPPISTGIPLSSPPQYPIFTATSAPPPAIEGVGNPHIETDTSLPAIVLDPISDSDALSEAVSVDMHRLDLGLSLPLHPSSLGEGSSLATAPGMLFPFLFQMTHFSLNGKSPFIFLCSASTPDLQPPFFNWICALAFFTVISGSGST